MDMRDAIESYNLEALQSYPRIVNEIIEEAINAEIGELSADKFVRAILSIGEQDAQGPDASRILSLSYADGDEGPVVSFYQFFNSVYRRAITRKGAFYYKHQQELDNLHQRFYQDKREKFSDLSHNTRATIESLIEHNSEVIEAKSKRLIEKKSYIQIRRIAQQEEKTSQQLEFLSSEHRLDIKGIYSALEKIRLRIDSHERFRRSLFQESQATIFAFFKDFLAALEDPMTSMTSLGFADLPGGVCVEELPLTDRERLNQAVRIILAADNTILPQNYSSKTRCYPMPKVVLVPVVGFITCATGMAVEKFRENVIFFPIRCLENPVTGLARELIKLKRKSNPRAVVMAREEYLEYVKANNLIGGGYENMYENFLRFCLGDENTIENLSPDEMDIIAQHFLPIYTCALYTLPWLRPTLARLGIETQEDRAEFNLEIEKYKEQPFAAGVMCADRAEKYRKYISALESYYNCDPDWLAKARCSLASNRTAARRFFNQAYRDDDMPRMSLYNTALIFYHEALENEGPARRELLKKAAILLRKIPEDAPPDLWSYKAQEYLNLCQTDAASDHQPLPEPTPALAVSEASEAPRPKESSVLKWFKGKFNNNP
ncbi:MAG: hypothetical protein JXA52_05570 [Planctomycetes bacterium]|nr:hypothetical protein [Planctomycetota bacterium]